MKRTWTYEIPIFYLLLWAVERAFFPGRPAFLGVDPHPYWLGIVLFALRYGLGAGLGSGAAAAGLFLGAQWFQGDRFHFEDADFYILPGLFVAVGALLGGVIDRLRWRTAETQRKVDAALQRNQELSAELEIQKKTEQALEQQIVSQMSTLVTLYQGSHKLGTVERGPLLEGILDFFVTALGADKAAVHLLHEGRWRLFKSRGWSQTDAYPRELDFTQGLIGKAGSEKRVVSLKDWLGVDPAAAWSSRGNADAVMAGPLRCDTGAVIGVFSVQNLPLFRFNSANVNLLSLLLDWAESSISKSLYFEELKSKLIMDEVYNVYNEKYFQSRSHQEFSRSKTYSLPFSILLVAVDGLKSLPVDQKVNLLLAIGRLLQEKSRDIDIVTKFPDPDTPFAVLIMTATAETAAELKDGILAGFKKLDLCPEASPRPSLRIGVGSYKPDMASEEDIIARARKALV
jgi:diguanylate cyclase (GGDEF)-like protein